MALKRLPVETMLPSAARLGIQSQNQENLLSEAKALVPDAQTFAKTILDKDIHAADANVYVGAINSLAEDYLSRYMNNPFYAFTKRGKEQAIKMQQIVNSPAFKSMETIKKQNDKEYARVADKGLQGNLVVNDSGAIAVFNQSTGRREFIDPGQFDNQQHVVLDIANDYGLLETREGSNRVASYDIDTLENVTENIRKSLQGLGISNWRKEYLGKSSLEGLGIEGDVAVTKIQEGSSNAYQRQQAVDRLRENGLSSTALKTLLSHYYRMNPDELGSEGANERANQWVGQQINRISEGQRIEDSSISMKNAVGIDSKSGSGGSTAPQLTINQILTEQFGTKKEVSVAPNGQMMTTNAPVVPLEAMHDRANPFKNPETGAQDYNLRVDSNPWFQVGDIDNIQIGVLKTNEDGTVKEGDYTRIPYEMLQNATIKKDPKAGTIVTRHVDASGEIIEPGKYRELLKKQLDGTLTQQELEKYYTGDSIKMQPGLKTKVVIPRRRNLFGIGVEDKEYINTLENYGYNSSENFTDEYNRHSGKASLSEPGSVFSIDDEVFVVDVFLPLSEGATGGITRLLGEDVLTEKAMNLFDNVRMNKLATQSVNIPSGSHPDFLTFGK